MAKYETLEEWVAAVPRDFQRLGHDTGWCECAGDNGYGPETFFTFTTVNGRKARRAIELLAAAGLLCESPCGPDDGEEYLPYLELLRTSPVAAVVDGLRTLAGTPLVRQEPFREQEGR
jgi:hypothetical protein